MASDKDDRENEKIQDEGKPSGDNPALQDDNKPSDDTPVVQEENQPHNPYLPEQSIIASSADVSSIDSFPVYCPDSDLPISELKESLSKAIKKTFDILIRACKNYDRKLSGKMTKSQLKQVLRTFCVPLTAAQFNAIVAEVKEDGSGKINYAEFFKFFSGIDYVESDHLFLKVQENLPVDEVELRIRTKITPLLRDVVRSFWLFDYNKDGYIQKKELKKIIENYCFKIADDLYNELWKRYDPQGIGVINYKDFLVKLGISVDRYKKYMPRETVARALCWVEHATEDYANALRYEQRQRRAAVENKDDPIIHGLPIEEAKDLLFRKLSRSGELLKRSFKMFDPQETGEININDFHSVLNFFILPMSDGMFKDMLERMKIEVPPSKKISWKNFMENFCKLEPDVQNMDPQEFTKLDKCVTVIERIKNHVLQPEARLKSVFTTKTKDKKWQVTRTELRKAIEKGLDFTLSDEEFQELVTILDPGHSNMISCKEFLRLFDSEVNSDVKARKAGIPIVNQIPLAPTETEKYKNLKGKRLKSKLKHYLNKNFNNVERGFLACDLDQCGLINPKLLRDVLENFCFPLTDEQFKEIMANFTIFRDRVNYHDFLNIYKKDPEEDTSKWVATVEKLALFRSKQTSHLAVDEVEEMLRDAVRTKKKGLLKDFKILDICKVGIAYKDDVRRLFNKYALRMNDHQFNTLWKDFPVNNFGQLIYDDFLEEYSKPKKKIKKIKEVQRDDLNTTTVKKESSPINNPAVSSLTGDHEPTGVKVVEPSFSNVEQGNNEVTEQIVSPSCFSVALGDILPSEKEELESKERRSVLDAASSERQPTRVVPQKKWGQTAGGNESLKNAILKEAPLLGNVFESMKIPILTNFRALRHRFRRMDPKITGVVDFVAFQTVLRQSNVYLTDEEVFHVLEYFDPCLSGKINYRDFLRIFVWYA